jgi:hypothetical protein
MNAPIIDLPHWNLYRSLENDLEICFRYVPPDDKHDEVTSDEFAKIILVAASEFENILSEFAGRISMNCNNINQYHNCLTSIYPNAPFVTMSVPRYSRDFAPLDDWTASKGPDWWSKGYNKIKHDRLSSPGAPTLKRALFAVASVQVVLFYFYKHLYGSVEIPVSVEPKLIEPRPLSGGVWAAASVSSVFDLP